MRYLEDFVPGDIHQYGSFDVTADEIIAFAREFDPQPFHLDEAAATASLLGGLAASGWQTAAIAMRLHCQHLLKDIVCLGSPGIAEMKWLKPVRKGYTVRLRVEIVSARPSRSRPGVGILEHHTTMLNQDDLVLMTSRGATLLTTRDAPPHISLYDPATAAKAPLWQKPAAIVPPPHEAADNTFVLSGWFDDIVIGNTIDLGVHHFDPDAIIAFASKWDPQVFHTDPHAARSGPYGSLSASGWHTAAAGMARHVLTRKAYTREGERRGLPEAPRGPSPGFHDMKWLQPVFSGDTLHYYMTPQNKRLTSRPGWGLMSNYIVGINQHGRKVYEYATASMWPVRPA